MFISSIIISNAVSILSNPKINYGDFKWTEQKQSKAIKILCVRHKEQNIFHYSKLVWNNCFTQCYNAHVREDK